ncbi:unnamed protein product [Ixodes hexagonus]
MPSEANPSPKYRLNTKVVVMSILIWAGTFVVFAAISVTLAITTNAMYFLFIIMGLVVSTFAMAFYKPEGPWEPMVPYSKLCEPRLETHAPIYVEERSSIYPPSPSIKSVTRSDPWLCTSAKTTLKGSFSSPRLQHRNDEDDTWPSAPPIRDPTAHLPAGFLPLVPTGAKRSRSSSKPPSPAGCEEVTATSCHQPYGCYESRVTRTNYEEIVIEGPNSDATDCIEVDVSPPADSKLLSKPSSTTVDVNEDSKDVPVEKKRRRLLWNIFGRSDERSLGKEVASDASERDDLGSKATLLAGEAETEPKVHSKLSGVANLPEYQKVVESIEKTIREANATLNVTKPKKPDEGAAKDALDIPPMKHNQPEVRKSSSMNESSPDVRALRGILNSTDTSASEGSPIPPFWRDRQSPGATSRTRSSGPSGTPSARSSTSRLTSGFTTPRDSEHRYLNEAFFKTHTSWDEGTNPESTTPFQNKSESLASDSLDILSKVDVQLAPDDKGIWGAPSPGGIKVGDKASQTSLHGFYPRSSGDDKDPFRMTPLVKADLVEVTVINNQAAPCCNAGLKVTSLEAVGDKTSPSKYVQATSKTVEASVQMGREVVTCDGDNNSPTKKSKRRKLKLLPRFLRGKKKK